MHTVYNVHSVYYTQCSVRCSVWTMKCAADSLYSVYVQRTLCIYIVYAVQGAMQALLVVRIASYSVRSLYAVYLINIVLREQRT